MKRFISNITLLIFGCLAILGIQPRITSAQIHQASIKNISETSPLYLIHAKHLSSNSQNVVATHWSHSSHVSHGSHESHYSHYSSR